MNFSSFFSDFCLLLGNFFVLKHEHWCAKGETAKPEEKKTTQPVTKKPEPTKDVKKGAKTTDKKPEPTKTTGTQPTKTTGTQPIKTEPKADTKKTGKK